MPALLNKSASPLRRFLGDALPRTTADSLEEVTE
jgi:hypothetical protein